MSLSPIFSIPSFSSTEFLILRISCSSDNVEVTSTKSYRRGFLCVCYGYITRSKVTFCQRGLLLPVYLCVKVNAWMRKLLKTLVFDLLHLSSPIYKYIHRYIYKYIYICYTHCSSSSMSTLVVQDLHLIWAALMSSQGAKQLMSADWSYHIYIMPWFLIHTKICVLVNEKGGGGSSKKFESVDIGGREGFKKCYSALTFFEWPLILEINNF